MKEKEKIFIFILSIIAIIIILIENIVVFYYNRNVNIDDIKQNEVLIGACDVYGPGIEIDIEDGTDLIHQEDIIILLDECKNAGSEVISINDVRITTNSYIYCDGGVILIDGIKIGNPFIIKAIGNPETLYSSVTRNKGYISTLQNDGIKVAVTKKGHIEVSKTNKKFIYDYIGNGNNLSILHSTNKLCGKDKIYGRGISIYFEYSSATALTLIQIINDLNSANAIAIEVNGNRILSNTDIVDISQKYILLNSIPLSHSFLICAIGNSNKMIEALNYSNSMINKLKNNNVDVLIEKNSILKIDKYVQNRGQNKLDVKYAIPAQWCIKIFICFIWYVV